MIIIEKKKQERKIQLLFLSLIIGSLSYNLFLFPLHLVTGGITGIATIIYYTLGIKPSLTILLESFLWISISYYYLGKERTIGTICVSILYPILIEITSKLNISFHYNAWVLIIISSILGGISNGLMYKSGYSNGGLPILSQILYKKYRYSISKTSFIINSSIVLISSFFFQLKETIYALFYLLINSLLIEKIIKIS